MAQILLITAHSSNLKLAVMVLEVLKHEVTLASNAIDGIHFAEKIKPDLILIDLHQLLGVDSLEVIRTLKASPVTKNIKIVAIATPDTTGEEILATGCAGYLSKPLQYESFAVSISRFLTLS